MSFDMRAYLNARHYRLVAAKLCIECFSDHDGTHVRCPDCHRGHIETSRAKYVRRASGYLCGACGNEGHNRRTCQVNGATL